MKIAGIISEVQRAFSGGVPSGKLTNLQWLEQKINEYSAQAIVLDYNGGKIPNSRTIRAASNYINPVTWLEFDLTINLNIQDTGSCYTKFDCPPMIIISNDRSGFAFVGDELTMTAFSEVKDPQYFANLSRTKNLEGIYYNCTGSVLKTIGDIDLNQLHVIGRPINPMDLPISSYDPENDEYPMDENLIPLMIDIMRAKEFGLILNIPQDNVFDDEVKQGGTK